MRVQRKQTRRFIELSAMNTLLLLVILLLFFGGPNVKAGPVGDFFKKVGQSISKPLQREPQPQPQTTRPQPAKTTPHVTRRSSSRSAPASAATPHAGAQQSPPAKEEEAPPASVRTVSAAELEKAKADLPYGIPVPGRKGMVSSPYLPEEDKYIDVAGFTSGSVVKDPYTGKFFLVP